MLVRQKGRREGRVGKVKGEGGWGLNPLGLAGQGEMLRYSQTGMGTAAAHGHSVGQRGSSSGLASSSSPFYHSASHPSLPGAQRQPIAGSQGYLLITCLRTPPKRCAYWEIKTTEIPTCKTYKLFSIAALLRPMCSRKRKPEYRLSITSLASSVQLIRYWVTKSNQDPAC